MMSQEHATWAKHRNRQAVRAHELGHYRLVDEELNHRPLVALTSPLPDYDPAPDSAPPRPITREVWL